MDFLTVIILFLGIFVLPIYLAFRDYKRKEKKIIDIEHKCSKIEIICNEIINNKLNLERKRIMKCPHCNYIGDKLNKKDDTDNEIDTCHFTLSVTSKTDGYHLEFLHDEYVCPNCNKTFLD